MIVAVEPLMLAKVAVPLNVGAALKTAFPVPVSFVSAAARFALEGVARKVATFEPRPETPVLIGSPVEVVRVSVSLMNPSPIVVDAEMRPLPFDARTPPVVLRVSALMRAFVAVRPVVLAFVLEAVVAMSVAKFAVPLKVGFALKTAFPVPVSSVSAAAKFALDGVARKVATFAPSPLIPVETGSPVAFVSVTEVGVPRIGVVKVGEVEKTSDPLPVSSVTRVMSSDDVSIDDDATLFMKVVQSAAVRHPCAPAVAVSQLSVLPDQVRPVPSVIRVDGVL